MAQGRALFEHGENLRRGHGFKALECNDCLVCFFSVL